jgi:hypothetical protein
VVRGFVAHRNGGAVRPRFAQGRGIRALGGVGDRGVTVPAPLETAVAVVDEAELFNLA